MLNNMLPLNMSADVTFVYLQMTYNSKQIRRPLLEVGELSLRLSRERASVTSAAGLTLECEIENAFCRLTVSGENFAATAGLLGVFDFDNNTDFMTSGWEMVSARSCIVRSSTVIVYYF